MDAQAKVKETQEAVGKLDGECDALRQQIASKDAELDRFAARPSTSQTHDPVKDTLQTAVLTVHCWCPEIAVNWWLLIKAAAAPSYGSLPTGA